MSLAKLRVLRNTFLGESPLTKDYWTAETLSLYHRTFAQRIGWKWEAVLEEAASLGWKGGLPILDWGCGTGIAGEKYLKYFPAEGHFVWDRSPQAVAFVQKRFPDAREGVSPAGDYALLISHTITELSNADLEVLVGLCARSKAVFWVEPGTPAASRKLIAVREKLREVLTPIAPCPHKAQCGLLAAGNEHHWCHHFAPPPDEAFQTKEWAEFGKQMGIDLRSLPVSYLVMTHGDITGGERVIGRPRAHTGYAQYLGCDEQGVSEKKVMKRDREPLYRQLKKGGFSLKV